MLKVQGRSDMCESMALRVQIVLVTKRSNRVVAAMLPPGSAGWRVQREFSDELLCLIYLAFMTVPYLPRKWSLVVLRHIARALPDCICKARKGYEH